MGKNLVIVNTEPRLVELPDVLVKLDKRGDKVIRPGYTGQKLLPGENDVGADYWDLIKGNPGVKILLACKTLVNNGEGEAKSILAGLDNLAPDVALRHIGKCENVKVLNEWKSGTESLQLRKHIEERVLELVHGQTGESETTPAADAPVDPVVEAKLEE